MSSELLFGALIVGLTIAGYVPLLYGMKNRQFQPHPITWTVWSLLLGLLAATLFKNNAGVAILMPSISVLFTSCISIYAWKNYSHLIKDKDYNLFYASILAVIVWSVLDNALYALVIMMVIDLIAMLPTIRQGWQNPTSQVPLAWVIASAKQLATLAALGHTITPETAAYPVFLFGLNFTFTLILMYRIYGPRMFNRGFLAFGA